MILIIGFTLIVLLSIIISVISVINDDEDKQNNIVSNSAIQASNIIEDEGADVAQAAIQYAKNEEKKLKNVDSVYKYFLIKQCLSSYYNITTTDSALNLIDEQAKKELNINASNVGSLYNGIDNPEFCIDRIYRQRIDVTKNIYVVYFRIKKSSNSDLENQVVFVKIDEVNTDFSIYPHEYLDKLNYLNLKAEDKIEISDKEIQKNDDNKYKSYLILEDEQTCIKEFFDRYKFDVQFDVNGLYNKIDKDYKSQAFENFEDFKTYINLDIENILNDEILKYKVTEDANSKSYSIIGKNNRYIFEAKNLMDYTVLLDNYTIILEEAKEQYNLVSMSSKAKYCITRIMNAINDKDYDFVYSKLNPVQKNNYYKNIDDFKEFITKYFYDENNYKIDEDYLRISSNVYQYDVSISNAASGITGYTGMVMTVTVGEDMDFSISINTK